MKNYFINVCNIRSMILLLSSLIISMGCAPRFDQMSNKLKNPNKVKYWSKQIDEDYYLYTEKFISAKDYHRPLNYMRWNMTENHQTLQNLKKIRGRYQGSVKNMKVCTRCLKAGKVIKVV